MKESIINIISEILRIDKDEVLNNLDSSDIWDSLKRVEIVFAVEDELDIRFEEDELASMNTPQKLIETAERKE